MKFKDFLFEHPVATVFLGWTGAEIVRNVVNLIDREGQRRHLERVGRNRIEAINSGMMSEEEAIEWIPTEQIETEETAKEPEQTELRTN